jgi:hypothetical protein
MKSEAAIRLGCRLCGLVFLGVLVFGGCSRPVQATDTAAAATNEPVVRLTVELRDGSRVVGQSLDHTLAFHSPLLGDLKLAVPDIRAIDCVATNVEKLTTADGDELTVQFAQTELRLQTGFGRVELPVASLRRLAVMVARPSALPRDGLVALWSAEGNADDSVGNRHGRLQNQTGYAPGKVGQAFAFHHIGDGVTAPATDLPVGTSDRTIDCWVYIESFLPDAEVGIVGYGKSGIPGQFYGLGASQNNVLIFSQWGDALVGPTLEAGRWYNFAVTSAGTMTKLYVDGVKVATGDLNFNTPAGNEFHIGELKAPGCVRQIMGLIDEVAVYNRALSEDEIKSVFEAAGSAPLTTQ